MAVRDIHPTLIVCPNGLKYFWAAELQRWAGVPEEQIAIYTSSDRGDKKFFHQPKVNYFIVHWEGLRLNIVNVVGCYWEAIIADEAHRAKNRNTKQSKALRSLYARRKYALTGTPIINRPDELWAILNFLSPKDFRSYWRFVEKYILAVHNVWGGIEILGVRDPVAFRDMLRPYTIRRRKVDVLKELPKKLYTTIPIELYPDQRVAYDKLKAEYVAELDDGEVLTVFNALALMTRLRQIASGLNLVSGIESSSKLDVAAEYIEDRDGEPTVVFSQFVAMTHGLQRRLAKKNIECAVVTGEVPAEERSKIVERFQAGLIPVIVLTTQVGGEGITLTRADTAVFLEKSWSPAQQLQAEDRLHRIGQEAENVNIVAIQTIDTVEEKVERALMFKQALFDQVFTGAQFRGLI